MTKQASPESKAPAGTIPPNPGSDAAVELGCTCAVLDNGRGAGYMGQSGMFWIHGGCPLHGERLREECEFHLAEIERLREEND